MGAIAQGAQCQSGSQRVTTRGVLIHAHNNLEMDYALIALCNAFAIKSHLQVPICLVTDEGSLAWLRQQRGDLVDQAFDQIVVITVPIPSNRRFCDTRSTSRTLPWYNRTRSDSYALSPFEETLLIDADYLILDDTLNCVWGSDHDVMLNRHVIPLNHGTLSTHEKLLEATGIELCWATCVYFRKSEAAAILFDIIHHVREHYDYYAMIYGFAPQQYRNDYAFSIAVHMISGFTRCDDIATLPSPFLFTSFDCDELIDVPAKDDLTFLMNDPKEHWRFNLTRTKGVSVHVMNKFSLVRQADKLLELYV